MSDLSAKFAALEELLNTNEAARDTDDNLTNTKLQSMLDILDIMNENAAANTKAILAALGQTGTCFPCPTPSITVPSIGTGPIPINTAHCQRSQAIIAVIHGLLNNMDTLQSFNVIGSFNVINDAIGQYISAIAAGDTVPLPSFPEAVNITGDYVSYAGERLFSGVGLVEQFSPLESAMLSAIHDTSTPDAAATQYASIIDASSASNGAKLLFKAIAYNALWSYYFDPGSTPDLSAYDGSACGFPACMTFTPEECITVTDAGGTSVIPNWSKYGITPVALPGQDHAIWVCIFGSGATWDTTGYSNVYKQNQAAGGSSGTFDETGAFLSLPFHDWYVIASDAPFALTFCGATPSPTDCG